MNAINIDQFMVDEVIVAGGTKLYTVDMKRFDYNGFFSIQLIMTGDGVLDGEYLLSHNGVNFVTPSGVPDSPIFTGFTAGIDMFSFEPILARYLQILLTETGTADPVTVTASLALQ